MTIVSSALPARSIRGLTASRSKVAVIRTRPTTVWHDVGRAMQLAEYDRHLPEGQRTGLKINVSWQVYYPGCSTTPWQLEGVIRRLLADGYKADALLGIHNRTVVVDSKVGELANKHAPVLRKMGVGWIHTFEPGIEWMRYEPRSPMLVLDRIFPNGIQIPRMLVGMNMVHLPTMKTHVFTGTTGAMKNAFGGLLHDRRHWTHGVIHETLVDLLAIQQEIHPGIFAVMDGTIAGDGAGPRAMVPRLANLLLASADQVAIDALAARLMGFDPLKIKYIRLAHERGLGCGDVRELDVVGEDVSTINLRFKGSQDTVASRGQKLIYHGPLRPFERFLLRTAIVPWSYAASRLYYDAFWYRFVGRRRVAAMRRTEWGKLFESYPL